MDLGYWSVFKQFVAITLLHQLFMIILSIAIIALVEKDVGRFEFIGNVAPEDIRQKYVGCMVSSVFSKGNQNPIKYVLHE